MDRHAQVDPAAYARELQARNARGECFICDLVANPRQGHVVFEDELAIAFLPRNLECRAECFWLLDNTSPK
jgi:hypothetical protein